MPSRPVANNPKHVRIRRARRDDLAALIDLENGVFASDRMSARQLRHHLTSPLAEILIAVRAGGAVGAAVLFFRRQHRIARLYSIAVAASARGAGVGLGLLAAAERVAKKRGSTLLRLEVRKDNRAAQNLYERQGYRHFGTKDRYYEDGHDAMRFEKTLIRGSSKPTRVG